MSGPKNDLLPAARVIARVLADVKLQSDYEALPEAKRKEASQTAWKIIRELQKLELRKEREARRAARPSPLLRAAE